MQCANGLKIRAAEKQEITWINRCYDEVEFIHSQFENEIIAIAELNGERAGLGRLVKIDDKNLELGGIYVFESFRQRGIAKEIVKFLLNQLTSSQTVYCIPFDHLLHFYKQSGFKNCFEYETVPQVILNKFRWCLKKYTDPFSLLKRAHVSRQEKRDKEISREFVRSDG